MFGFLLRHIRAAFRNDSPDPGLTSRSVLQNEIRKKKGIKKIKNMDIMFQQILKRFILRWCKKD